MWGSRARSKTEHERYESRMVDRLRGVGNAGRAVNDADPDVTRARLERMRHGANRNDMGAETGA